MSWPLLKVKSGRVQGDTDLPLSFKFFIYIWVYSWTNTKASRATIAEFSAQGCLSRLECKCLQSALEVSITPPATWPALHVRVSLGWRSFRRSPCAIPGLYDNGKVRLRFRCKISGACGCNPPRKPCLARNPACPKRYEGAPHAPRQLPRSVSCKDLSPTHGIVSC